MNLMRRLCERASRMFLERQIWDRAGGSLYLSRFYILGGPRDLDAFDDKGAPPEDVEWSSLPFNLYLHKFHRSDDDGALHNHPWGWSVSLILAGGYEEERRVIDPQWGWKVIRRKVKPFRLNIILGGTYHRVDLLEKDCWSLFLAGPKTHSWNFWDRLTQEYTPWREFIARKRGVKEGEVASTYEPGEKVIKP